MRAPVVVTLEQLVDADTRRLWERHVDAGAWTRWHPDVSWVGTDVPLRAAATFDWVWRGTRARSTVTGYREGELVMWATETLSGNSTMRWTFAADGPGDPLGKTTVAVRAALGAGHVLARRPAAARAGLERALARWIDALASDARDVCQAVGLGATRG